MQILISILIFLRISLPLSTSILGDELVRYTFICVSLFFVLTAQRLEVILSYLRTLRAMRPLFDIEAIETETIQILKENGEKEF